ncbi:MAG: SHOCT domain-containing protein [Thermomonas sp.]|uniref:SHOCT domain-containing protein n=1 Tax=Thermomonas sp. TaxID=1971895 RepID=UPI00262A73CD|nr:SHOCT domain-containing protein [Thermomonas sp.]MCC7096866.1 SHOCT domain-containing protein [Thermomonas sp.]
MPTSIPALFEHPAALAWIVAAVAILAGCAIYVLRRSLRSRSADGAQVSRIPTVTGGLGHGNPFDPKLPEAVKAQTPAPPGQLHSQVSSTLTVNGQVLAGDLDLGSVLSDFMGDGGDGLARQILEAAAHNTSGKPTVFVNGKQVDADSIDFAALVARAPTTSSGRAGGDIEARLHTLKNLLDDGLINATEYEAKKSAILQAL